GVRAAMSCSVVVATSGQRRVQLAALRDALDAQAEPPGGYEVVIVEDVERRGPAAARNEGVARAGGELVVFTDDDCEPAPGWLVALVARWGGRAEVGVGGTVINGLRRNRFAVASQVVHETAHAWANRDRQARFFSSNNLALPRAALLDIGGFDAGLRCAEDRDLCDRWIAAGLWLEHEPRAIVRHAHRMRARGFLAQHAGYGHGAWRFRVAQAASGRPWPPANAMDVTLLHDLVAAIDEVAADLPSAVVLAGLPGFFSAGADLKAVPGYGPAEQRAMVEGINRMALDVYALACPVVGAITGHAIAGGLVLAVCTDLRVASSEGKYGLTEVKVGVPYPQGAIGVVQAELQPQTVRRLAFGNELHDAQTCLDLGVFDEVVEPDAVLPRAREIARRLAALP